MALDQLSPSDKTNRECAHVSAGRSHDGSRTLAVFTISCSASLHDRTRTCTICAIMKRSCLVAPVSGRVSGDERYARNSIRSSDGFVGTGPNRLYGFLAGGGRRHHL